MRKQLIVLVAAVALLLVGAVPVSAAPGGVPGPPPGHGKSSDDVVTDDGDAAKKGGPPEWAKAYGKRIKDFYGIPFGHLQQCARADAAVVDGDEGVADEATEGDEEGVKKALEACDDLPEYVFPDDQSGAKAFYQLNEMFIVMTDGGLPLIGM